MALSVSPGGAVSVDLALRSVEHDWTGSEADEAGGELERCSRRLMALRRSDTPELRTELNLLLDLILSERHSGHNRAQDVCSLLVHTSRLVPHSQEHLVTKLCQMIHQLLNQLQVIVDEQTLDVLVSYCFSAVRTCSCWTHSEILLALSALVYGNGARCQRHFHELLGQDGVLRRYADVSQADLELRRSALHCIANLCLSIPGHPYLEEQYKAVCYRIFLQTLRAPKPLGVDELLFCTLLQSALKGMQHYLTGAKWKAGPEQDLDSLLAVLKKFMFFGLPGINVEMPLVLYSSPLPLYEALPAAKTAPVQEKTAPVQEKTTMPQRSKKRKARGKGKKARAEEGRTDGGGEEGEDDEPSAGRRSSSGGGFGGVVREESQTTQTSSSCPHLYPAWRKGSSDSELSDPEGGAQSKLRLYQARVRQSALQCFLAVVKSVEKRLLYGYWSYFVPDAAGPGSPPSLSLLTITLKDPSPKVRAASLQALSALLEGSRQFLSAAEDTGTSRQAFTAFSTTLASSLRELHRSLLLALLAESSSQTLTQLIKCLAHLVSNVPYKRLRPGLLSSVWKQIRPYVRHRDVNVRVSSLTLFGALLSAQAPLPEIRLLLQDQATAVSGPRDSGGASPQEHGLAWRQPRRGETELDSPSTGQTAEGSVGTATSCWLLRLCLALVSQPREEPGSDREASDSTLSLSTLEPSPVRLEALQVLAHLVKGYFSLAQSSLLELAQLSARCLREQDPSIQLHGAKLLEELGTGIIQQHRADGNSPDGANVVPVCQVVQFWCEVLSGPLIGALQNEQHPTLQTSACDTLASILPQAFTQLPDKTQVLCITLLLGLTYSESSLVKAAAVRALGIYILFPSLREDVMFVADAANAVLTALDDRSPNVRAKAAWSLGNLTDTLIVNMEAVGAEFQQEISDMLLLKMLKCATRASADKDRVKSNAVRALGNLLRFLQSQHLNKAVFQQQVEQAFGALVQTVCADATMKVRWNACYALGNAFHNVALPLGTTGWSADAFSALSSVVTSCKNFKVRIKSAAALSVPASRHRYGDAQQFSAVWRALALALERSEDTDDFLEFQYCASLRSRLCHALLHLLSLCRPGDLAAVRATLDRDSGAALRGFLLRYLCDCGGGGRNGEEAGDETEPRDGRELLDLSVSRIKALRNEAGAESRTHLDVVLEFLDDVTKSCEATKAMEEMDGIRSQPHSSRKLILDDDTTNLEMS